MRVSLSAPPFSPPIYIAPSSPNLPLSTTLRVPSTILSLLHPIQKRGKAMYQLPKILAKKSRGNKVGFRSYLLPLFLRFLSLLPLPPFSLFLAFPRSSFHWSFLLFPAQSLNFSFPAFPFSFFSSMFSLLRCIRRISHTLRFTFPFHSNYQCFFSLRRIRRISPLHFIFHFCSNYHCSLCFFDVFFLSNFSSSPPFSSRFILFLRVLPLFLSSSYHCSPPLCLSRRRIPYATQQPPIFLSRADSCLQPVPRFICQFFSLCGWSVDEMRSREKGRARFG